MKSGFPDLWVVGIDDTDTPSQGGTGQLARRLAAEIARLGLGNPAGVTRHQLFEGPGVPKTSRNSAAAIGIAGPESADGLFGFACEVVEREAIPRSDPGVAVAPLQPDPALLGFSHAAQTGLVTRGEAGRVADQEEVLLAGLGGDDGGVIGALAAVGLRGGGNDGRYVGLDGIRDVSGEMAVGELLDRTEVAAVVDQATGNPLQPNSRVDLGDWVRPRLVGGRPVLVAVRKGERWSNADARPH